MKLLGALVALIAARHLCIVEFREWDKTIKGRSKGLDKAGDVYSTAYARLAVLEIERRKNARP
jgi:hypothetical protein